jgi:hypothetical protein
MRFVRNCGQNFGEGLNESESAKGLVMTLTVTPTEYQGVRFDSKSEAVFARLLDLHGIKWAYQHPVRHAGHDWDFLIWGTELHLFTGCDGYNSDGEPINEPMFGLQEAASKPILIELKPSKPNASYLQRLSKPPFKNELRAVVWGNPWSGLKTEWGGVDFTYMGSVLDGGNWKADEPFREYSHCLYRCFDESLIQQAVKYRFDLA